MSTTSRDISILGKHKDTTWYTHTCSCGCGEQVVIEVTSPEDMGLVQIEFTVTAKAYNRSIKLFWGAPFLTEVWWRVKTVYKVLIKGEVSLCTGICINSKQGIEDYINALTKASGVFMEVE